MSWLTLTQIVSSTRGFAAKYWRSASFSVVHQKRMLRFGRGMRAVGDELRECASDLEQARAAARVVVRRVLLFLKVRAEDDVLAGRRIGAGNERLDERHPRLRMLARAELGADGRVNADGRGCRGKPVVQRDAFAEREDERERRVLAVDRRVDSVSHGTWSG